MKKNLFQFFARFFSLAAAIATVSSWAQQLDWGDAPPTYATRKADNGPRHAIDPALKLGQLIDAEANGLPSAGGDGDDLDGQDDEDGIVSAGPMIIGQSVPLGIEASAAGFLDAWIDFNRDGDFADAGEKIFDKQTLAAGTNSLTLLIPAAASVGGTAARLAVLLDQ